MVQGYLKPFLDSFQALKYLVVKENMSPMELQPHASETDPPAVFSIPTEEEHHDPADPDPSTSDLLYRPEGTLHRVRRRAGAAQGNGLKSDGPKRSSSVTTTTNGTDEKSARKDGSVRNKVLN